MAQSSSRVVIILAGVLVAAITVSLGLWWMLPSQSDVAQDVPIQSPLTPTTTGENGFNLSVFQKSAYLNLDKQPIQTNALPVAPPATTGKANPFL